MNERNGKIQAFEKTIFSSCDLSDNLQQLVEHLQEFTGATAAYIGHLVAPKKPIDEGDDDQAHSNDDSEKIIKYTHATTEVQYLINKVLLPSQGLTFDVFNDPEVPDEEEQAMEEAEEDEDGEPIEKPKKEQAEVLPHFLLVKEVVREPRMHFFRVPRLGSFFAIRIEYNSCLN